MRIVRARSEHAVALVGNLNAFSRAELELVRGESDRVKSLEDELSRSTLSFAAFIDDKLAAVWGVYGTSLTAGHGYMWMLSSKVAEESPFIFARHSQLVLAGLLEIFPTIHCFVDPNYTRSIKWLKWLGFEVGKAEDYYGSRLCGAQRRA